jgi:positive regulator of sigma E activity
MNISNQQELQGCRIYGFPVLGMFVGYVIGQLAHIEYMVWIGLVLGVILSFIPFEK